MRLRRLLIAALLSTAALLPAVTSAQRLPPSAVAVRALPRGSDHALAMLAGFADGRAATPFEREYAAALARVPGARAHARRLVTRFTSLPPTDRAALFQGRTVDLRRVPLPHEISTYEPPVVTLNATVDTLPPEPAKLSSKTYELSYSGFKCRKVADADANGDEVLVYANVLGRGASGYQGAAFTPTLAPQTGVVAGAASTTGQGIAWSSAAWPAYAPDKTGVLLVTALLQDDGEAAIDKQRLDLLIEAAKIFATTIQGDDRMAALKTALEYHVALLRMDDPARWTERAVQITAIDGAAYDALWKAQPTTVDGISRKLEVVHDTRGSDYSLYFGAPTAVASEPSMTVQVKVQRVEAIGTLKDKENGLADLSVVAGVQGASATRALPKDKNDVTASWTVKRTLFPQETYLGLQVREVDAPPKWHEWPTNFGYGCGWCAANPSDAPPYVQQSCHYEGVCSAVSNTCDASPATNVSGSSWTPQMGFDIALKYDPASGEIRDAWTNVLIGKKGDTLVSTGTGERAVRVTYSITH